MGVQLYRMALAQAVHTTGLDSTRWGVETWKNLFPHLNQEVLNDAHTTCQSLLPLFQEAVGTVECRPCKQMSRVSQKMTEQPNFRVVSDLMAVRVPCEVTQIADKVDKIRQVCQRLTSTFYVRGASEAQPHGSFKGADGKYVDIIQYAYAYLDGYIMEFQVGERFAAETFQVDSQIRDLRNAGFASSAPTDWWTEDFYSKVKAQILAKANGEVVTPESVQALRAKAFAVFVPKTVQAQINSL